MAQEQELMRKAQNVTEEEVDESRLPFPNAPVVRVMREAIDEDKIISKRVKEEMNKWLAEVCRDVSRELNKAPYKKIEGDDFSNAIKKYKQFEALDEQKQRIKKSLGRIVEDVSSLAEELNRAKSE